MGANRPGPATRIIFSACHFLPGENKKIIGTTKRCFLIGTVVSINVARDSSHRDVVFVTHKAKRARGWWWSVGWIVTAREPPSFFRRCIHKHQIYIFSFFFFFSRDTSATYKLTNGKFICITNCRLRGEKTHTKQFCSIFPFKRKFRGKKIKIVFPALRAGVARLP